MSFLLTVNTGVALAILLIGIVIGILIDRTIGGNS